jgi:hypothetical protein
LTAWTLKMGSKSCPETSVNNDQYTLRNNQQEQRSHLHDGGNLKYHFRHLSECSTKLATTTTSNVRVGLRAYRPLGLTCLYVWYIKWLCTLIFYCCCEAHFQVAVPWNCVLICCIPPCLLSWSDVVGEKHRSSPSFRAIYSWKLRACERVCASKHIQPII